MPLTTYYNNPKTLKRRRSLRKNQTDAEKILWTQLRNKQLDGWKFFRQYSVGPFILDFYCPKAKLAIELDGGQHAQKENKLYDLQRTDFLNERNIEVIRFWNNDVLGNLEGVLQKIVEYLTPSIKIAPP